GREEGCEPGAGERPVRAGAGPGHVAGLEHRVREEASERAAHPDAAAPLVQPGRRSAAHVRAACGRERTQVARIDRNLLRPETVADDRLLSKDIAAEYPVSVTTRGQRTVCANRACHDEVATATHTDHGVAVCVDRVLVGRDPRDRILRDRARAGAFRPGAGDYLDLDRRCGTGTVVRRSLREGNARLV